MPEDVQISAVPLPERMTVPDFFDSIDFPAKTFSTRIFFIPAKISPPFSITNSFTEKFFKSTSASSGENICTAVIIASSLAPAAAAVDYLVSQGVLFDGKKDFTIRQNFDSPATQPSVVCCSSGITVLKIIIK